MAPHSKPSGAAVSVATGQVDGGAAEQMGAQVAGCISVSREDTLNMLCDAASGAFNQMSLPDRLTEAQVDELITSAERHASVDQANRARQTAKQHSFSQPAESGAKLAEV